MSTSKSKRTKSRNARLANPIVLFFHCEQCCEEEHEYPGDKSVGYTSDRKLAMWCEIHDCLIVEWELKDPPNYTCYDCGEAA
jgi:hypothetical protein